MFLHLLHRHYFKKDRHFYICSFGGCGSWIIAQYLSNFGNVHHVHSRKPPTPAVTTVEDEHFTTTPSPYLSNIVLYVYRDPVAALASVQRRFQLSDHLRNIECDQSVSVQDCVSAQRDLFGLAEFYNNYTRPNPFRRYKICCVKYEDFFNRLPEFNITLGLVDYPKLYPKKKENKNQEDLSDSTVGLDGVYASLRADMRVRPFIFLS